SPEQTSGQRAVLDHRTDIYSLAATFYELVTLEPVFEGETRQELMYQILHQEPRLPRQVNRAIPAELETIVLKALSKTPADRYATAADLAADVQRYLDDQPIHARRPSLVDRVRKWSRRHPSVVVASVLSLTVLAVGLLISNRLISQEQQKTKQALLSEKQRAEDAELQLTQARGAVSVLIDVTEKELANEPSLREARLEVLQTALDYYRTIIEQNRGNPASEQDLEAIQQRVRATLSDLIVIQDEWLVLRQSFLICLLSSPTIRDELDIDASVGPRLAELCRRWSEDLSHASIDVRGRGDDVLRHFVKLAELYWLRLCDMLTTRQLERVQQISVQYGGLYAFKGPAIVESLRLPRDGRMAVPVIESEFNRSASQQPGSPRRHLSVEDTLNLSLDDAVLYLLSKLTKNWHKTIGAPFSGLRESSTVNDFEGKRSNSQPPQDP
ncbi:MAG: serine/threonine protein kinase, partial [Planctomycetaceae bacterium]